ncbi:MAG TPA: hypothetical protein DCY80_20485 [Solibacterales bacterium]|nr:hypothetical protein [Bryobacterales bacterium]
MPLFRSVPLATLRIIFPPRGQPRPFALPALDSGEHEIRLHWSPGMNPPPAGRFADGAAPRPRLLSVTPGAPTASAVHILRLRVE